MPSPSADSHDADYAVLLERKRQRLQRLLSPFTDVPIEVFASRPTGFRMRAEFRMWHEGDKLDYVMFPKGRGDAPFVIEQFPPGSPAIQALMPKVRDYLQSRPALRRKLFQADFLSSRDGDCLLSLLYHRPLDEDWEQAAKAMEQTLGVAVLGRSRKKKTVLSRDYITEHFQLGERRLQYMQIENSFTQPNADINEKMLNWASARTADSEGDLLELYCGNGNFSIALSPRFRKVLATEIDKSAIRAAQANKASNAIANLELVRMSAADVAAALSGVRPFRRLKHLDLASYQFSTVLVDPPRAGLDEDSLAFIQRFDTIVYISCNPDTLAANLDTLCSSHKIHALALFDQFPMTEHIETGVLLRR